MASFYRGRPMPLRLIRLPAREAGGTDVWLVTNVLDPRRLSWQTASRLFAMRWEQEVFYRSYKCTLSQAKLASRSNCCLSGPIAINPTTWPTGPPS